MYERADLQVALAQPLDSPPKPLTTQSPGQHVQTRERESLLEGMESLSLLEGMGSLLEGLLVIHFCSVFRNKRVFSRVHSPYCKFGCSVCIYFSDHIRYRGRVSHASKPHRGAS